MESMAWLGILLAALSAAVIGCGSSSSTSKDRGTATADDDNDDDDGDGDDNSEQLDDDSSGGGRLDAGRAKADASDGSKRLDGGMAGSGADASVNAHDSAVDARASKDAQVSSLDASGDPSPTGHFPAVIDTGAEGPFTAKTVENTGPGGGYTLFHPVELAPNGALNPIVTWGNGGATTPDWYPMLPHLASHGFVVIASNNITVSGAEVKAGIDWLLEQNEQSSSAFYHKLDPESVAGVGYSLGGLANLEIADDPRLVTIVIISGANVNADLRAANMPKLHTPIAYFCTDDADSKGNCANDFMEADVPAFFGVLNGTDHFSVVLDDMAIGRLSSVTTAWLRWQLMKDPSFKDKFVGNDCGLCTDSAWTVEPQKNLQ